METLPTEDIIIEFERQDNEYDVLIRWEKPTSPNGFILNYTLFRDNTQIFMSYYDNDGYYSNDNLTMEYLDTIDTLGVSYNYKIEYGNSVGSFNSSDSNIIMYNRNPQPISNLLVNAITNTSANISWNYPQTD